MANGDILREIFGHLRPWVDPFGEDLPWGWPITEYTLERRRTLARAACVSRTMSEYALDMLWERLATLNNLLDIVPPVCVQNQGRDLPGYGPWVCDALSL